MIFAELYKSQHTKELSGFRMSMKCNNFIFFKEVCMRILFLPATKECTLKLITFEGFSSPNPPRQPVCLTTNVATGDQ